MNALIEVKRITHPGPAGRQFHCLDAAGRVFASVEAWAAAIGWPKNDAWHFQTLLQQNAAENPSWAAEHNGTQVYRWHAADDALLAFERAFLQHRYGSRDAITQAAYARLHENYKAIRNWGRDLQEKAISGAYQTSAQIKPEATAVELVVMAMQKLAPQVVLHEKKLIEHDADIAELRSVMPAPRNVREFITVKQAIAERMLDPTIMPLAGSRWNLAQVVGHRLAESKAERGPAVSARVEGSSVTTQMQTWRRGAIYDLLSDLTAA